MKIQANGITINYRFDGPEDAPVIIVGEDDPACPVSSAKVLHDGIARSRSSP
jgi:hypothetical protein